MKCLLAIDLPCAERPDWKSNEIVFGEKVTQIRQLKTLCWLVGMKLSRASGPLGKYKHLILLIIITSMRCCPHVRPDFYPKAHREYSSIQPLLLL